MIKFNTSLIMSKSLLNLNIILVMLNCDELIAILLLNINLIQYSSNAIIQLQNRDIIYWLA